MPPADVVSAVEICLTAAVPFSKCFSEKAAVNISPRNMRAIAASLYQQRHGGAFAQLQLFPLEDGATAFSRPTFKRFRQLLRTLPTHH